MPRPHRVFSRVNLWVDPWYKRAMSKYQRTVPRIMTSDEARAKCAEAGLDDKVTEFVVGCFDQINDRSDAHHQQICSVGCRNDSSECEATTGEDGKIAWEMSWEGVMDELAEAMGFDLDAEDYCHDDHPEIGRVWDLFFQE